MKRTFILMGLLALSTFASAWQGGEVNMEEIRRDIRIVKRIMQAAVEDEARDRRHQSFFEHDEIHISAVYLRNQGILLEVDMSDSPLERMGVSLAGMRMGLNIDIPPVPIAPIVVDTNWDVGNEEEREEYMAEHREALEDYREEIAEIAEESAESWIDFTSEMFEGFDHYTAFVDRDEVRRLREEQRLATREIQRELREVRQRLRKQRQDLSKEELEVLKNEAQEFREKIRQTNETFKVKFDTAREKYQAKYQDHMKKLEVKLAQILCDFGASLRSLPDNEHLTLILKGGTALEGGEIRDKVFVFKKQDLVACRDGQMDTKQLLERSKPYSF